MLISVVSEAPSEEASLSDVFYIYLLILHPRYFTNYVSFHGGCAPPPPHAGHAAREASSFVAVGTLQLLLSLLAQMKLLQLRLPLLHAQVLRHSQSFVIHLSLGLVLRGISDSLPRSFSSTRHF